MPHLPAASKLYSFFSFFFFFLPTVATLYDCVFAMDPAHQRSFPVHNWCHSHIVRSQVLWLYGKGSRLSLSLFSVSSSNQLFPTLRTCIHHICGSNGPGKFQQIGPQRAEPGCHRGALSRRADSTEHGLLIVQHKEPSEGRGSWGGTMLRSISCEFDCCAGERSLPVRECL